MPNSQQTVMSVGEFEPTDINNATIANMVGQPASMQGQTA